MPNLADCHPVAAVYRHRTTVGDRATASGQFRLTGPRRHGDVTDVTPRRRRSVACLLCRRAAPPRGHEHVKRFRPDLWRIE
jgi:hypothetical protein